MVTSSSLPSEPNDPLDQLVIACLECMEVEGEPGRDRFLDAHPEHADRIRARMVRLQEIGFLGTPSAADIPERLGPFQLLSVLGRGGMGVVYRALEPALNRQVAVKVIRPELFHFANAKERFRREVTAAAGIDHPVIVSVHAVGEEAGVPYYAMELVDGCDLGAALKKVERGDRSRLTGADLARAIGASDGSEGIFASTSWVSVCFEICEQLASALEHAHRSGVLHRDLKPANIMITRDGRVRLLDFGLASTQSSATITAAGSQIGSLAYMAPEQVRGDVTAIDERTDVYQLGVTLFELLAFRSPYLAATLEETRRRILDGVPGSPSSDAASVPWDAATVCLTAMDVDPRRRYASMKALRADLQNVLARRPINARRPSPWLRARRWTERHPAASVALAALVLITAATAGYALKLNATNAELLQSNAAKERALHEKELALENAIAKQAEADRNFTVALHAAKKLLQDMGFTQLRDVPGMDATRRTLLLKASGSYRELLAIRPNDTQSRVLLAEAHLDHANVLLELGRLTEARSVIEDGIALLEDLRREYPREHKYASGYASCCDMLSQVLEAMGLGEESVDVAMQSLVANRAVVAELADQPSRKDYLEELRKFAGIMHNVANKLARANRTEDAIELFEEARDYLTTTLADDRDPLKDYNLVGVLANLGRATWSVGDSPRAQELEREAVSRGADLIKRHPADRDFRHIHAFALMSLMYVLDGDAEILEAGRQAEEAYRKQLRDHPTVIDRFQLADTLAKKGDALRRSDRLDQALSAYRESLQEAKSIEQLHGAKAQVSELTARIQVVEGEIARGAGREAEAEQAYRAAMATVEALQKQEPGMRDSENFLAIPSASLAALKQHQDRLDEARSLVDRALEIARRHASPNTRNRCVQADCRLLFAQIAVAAGDHRAVMQACKDLVSAPVSWRRNRTAAGLAVHCLALVDEEMLAPAEHRSLHELYEQCAVDLLRAALERDECDRAALASDDAWLALRDVAPFRALMNQD